MFLTPAEDVMSLQKNIALAKILGKRETRHNLFRKLVSKHSSCWWGDTPCSWKNLSEQTFP